MPPPAAATADARASVEKPRPIGPVTSAEWPPAATLSGHVAAERVLHARLDLRDRGAEGRVVRPERVAVQVGVFVAGPGRAWWVFSMLWARADSPVAPLWSCLRARHRERADGGDDERRARGRSPARDGAALQRPIAAIALPRRRFLSMSGLLCFEDAVKAIRVAVENSRDASEARLAALRPPRPEVGTSPHPNGSGRVRSVERADACTPTAGSTRPAS